MRETTPETQGKTTNPMDNQQETKAKITKSKDWCSVRGDYKNTHDHYFRAAYPC